MARATISYTFEYEVTPGGGGYQNCATVQDCLDYDSRACTLDPVGNFKAMVEEVGLHPTVTVQGWH